MIDAYIQSTKKDCHTPQKESASRFMDSCSFAINRCVEVVHSLCIRLCTYSYLVNVMWTQPTGESCSWPNNLSLWLRTFQTIKAEVDSKEILFSSASVKRRFTVIQTWVLWDSPCWPVSSLMCSPAALNGDDIGLAELTGKTS